MTFMWFENGATSPPLPAGERSDREAIRVRGIELLDILEPPHPNPLPCGERERAELVAGSSIHDGSPA
jgi:hypothetical protein